MTEVEKQIADSVRQHLDQDGKLPCAAAFRAAERLGVAPLEIGQAADALGVKLSRCQLGLFGYGTKPEGQHKVVGPAEAVEAALAQAIRDSLTRGSLPCDIAWEIADAKPIPRMEVASAADALGIKIVRCQLGAF